MPNNSFTVLMLLVILAGNGAVYLAAAPVLKDLRDISRQLSALRQPLPGTPRDHTRDDASFPAMERMDELPRLVSEAVLNALLLHCPAEDTSCLYPTPPEHRAAAVQTGTVADTGRILAGTEQADAILVAAIDRGVWDRDSALSFAAVLDALPDAELAEAYRQLSQAVNSGDLQLPENFDPILLLTGSNFGMQ